MSSHNYQQKILRLQQHILISIQLCVAQMRLVLVLSWNTFFFDAHIGSKTAINEEVVILKTLQTLPTTALICSLTHWLMNRQKSDLCDVLCLLTQLQLDISSSLWTFSNYLWDRMLLNLQLKLHSNSVIASQPSIRRHQINFFDSRYCTWSSFFNGHVHHFCWTSQRSDNGNA